MKKLNPKKNEKLKKERGAAIEDVVENGELLEVRINPRFSNQMVEVYLYENYVWAVITATNPDRYITMYKSRKLKKEFGL